MFSLESAMAAWRQQLRAAGLRPEPLEELELHVCEEFQRLVKAGVGEEEAFQRAAQALGPAPALSCEFQKVARVRQAAQWKMFRNVFFVVALAYPVLVGALALDSERGVFMDSTAWQRASCLAAGLAFSLLAAGLCWGCRRFPALRERRMRDRILVPVVLWLVAFAFLIVPSQEWSLSQSGVLSLWGFAPFGILIGWLWGMTAAEARLAAA